MHRAELNLIDKDLDRLMIDVHKAELNSIDKDLDRLMNLIDKDMDRLMNLIDKDTLDTSWTPWTHLGHLGHILTCKLENSINPDSAKRFCKSEKEIGAQEKPSLPQIRALKCSRESVVPSRPASRRFWTHQRFCNLRKSAAQLTSDPCLADLRMGGFGPIRDSANLREGAAQLTSDPCLEMQSQERRALQTYE